MNDADAAVLGYALFGGERPNVSIMDLSESVALLIGRAVIAAAKMRDERRPDLTDEQLYLFALEELGVRHRCEPPPLSEAERAAAARTIETGYPLKLSWPDRFECRFCGAYVEKVR